MMTAQSEALLILSREMVRDGTDFRTDELGVEALALMEAADKLDEYHELLKKFNHVMNVLSTRVGLTVKEVAEILNPIGDEVRETLKKK